MSDTTLSPDDSQRAGSPFGAWFAARVRIDPHARTLARDFFAGYVAWCGLHDIEKPMSQRAFGDALADRQIIRAGQDAAGNVIRAGAALRG